jgi:hypothetical protein
MALGDDPALAGRRPVTSPLPDAPSLPGRRRRFAVALVWVAAFAVFVGTAYPTITWWDSSSYSLAATTLGVTPPPGSLLLTLVGWAVTRLPTGLPPAHMLNLVAGVLAATSVTLVFAVGLDLFHTPGESGATRARKPPAVAVAGAAAGALTFAFSATLWRYAVQFTPYVLTSVFTGLLLWTMLRWWRSAADRESWRWMLLLGLLFGLDYSVHRTNALMLPVALVWMLILRPRALRAFRFWIAGAGGLLAGAALQLLVIPIAARHPVLNIGDPSTWSRFYDYESLAQYGGGWLVQFYPRHAALWSVQALDFIRAFGANFLWLHGPGWILGALPAVLGVVGWVGLWRRDRRLAVAFAALVVLYAALTVAYFNIPAHFFRPFDRHYLPVFVAWGVLVCRGAGEIATLFFQMSSREAWRAVRWAGFLLVLAPLSQLAHNRRTDSGAGRWFAEDYAANLLNGLPPRAILFTVGDNDTFPLLYLQSVAHVRPDVEIVNLPLSNVSWYLDELARRDPTFPLPPGYADSHGAQAWTDTTLTIPVTGTPGQFGLPDSIALPRSITVHVAPTMAGKYVLLQDLVLLQILRRGQWHRPLCFSVTAQQPGLPGLAPYARLDGIFWRIVPHAEPPANLAVLRENLLETYRYRGYADPSTPLDEVSRMLGVNYYAPLVALARAEAARGRSGQCRQWRDAVLRALPLSRLEPDRDLRQEIEAACEGAGAGTRSVAVHRSAD